MQVTDKNKFQLRLPFTLAKPNINTLGFSNTSALGFTNVPNKVHMMTLTLT